jgi:hypothetical protein
MMARRLTRELLYIHQFLPIIPEIEQPWQLLISYNHCLKNDHKAIQSLQCCTRSSLLAVEGTGQVMRGEGLIMKGY